MAAVYPAGPEPMIKQFTFSVEALSIVIIFWCKYNNPHRINGN
jgi:hypothetical protein